MKDKDILRDLSQEIIADMDSWHKDNPSATFLEIEEKSRELVSKLEVAKVLESCTGARRRELERCGGRRATNLSKLSSATYFARKASAKFTRSTG